MHILRIMIPELRTIESTLTEKIYPDAVPGTVLDSNLNILCGDGRTIQITKLQKPGGKKLNTKEFLCGYKIPVGDILQ